MIGRSVFALLLVALCGACTRPQADAMVGAAPAQQTERFPNGDVYVGQMSGGLREGQGVYTWADGRRYEGSFRAGLEDGQGTYSYPNGEKYEGQFQAKRRNGQGSYSWPDGRKYVGEFKDDRPHGRGTYSWPDGRKYVGEMRDDRPNGQGTFTYADGRQQSGLFRNGEYIGGTDEGLVPGSISAAAIASEPGRGEVQLQRRGGTYVVAAELNGEPSVDFHIDSGAADVSIPADMFQRLYGTGKIQAQDMLGSETYTLANGVKIKAQTFRIRSLRVGTVELQNVRASVSQYTGPPLIGMSFLGRFSSWSVDNGRRVLILK